MSGFAVGFAVFTAGRIDIDTVSSTERAARINWLVRHGTMIYASMTDDEIELLFFRETKNKPLAELPTVASVRIERMADDPGIGAVRAIA